MMVRWKNGKMFIVAISPDETIWSRGLTAYMTPKTVSSIQDRDARRLTRLRQQATDKENASE